MKKNRFWKILTIATSALMVLILLIGTVIYRASTRNQGTGTQKTTHLSNEYLSGDRGGTYFSANINKSEAVREDTADVKYPDTYDEEYEQAEGGDGTDAKQSGNGTISMDKLIYRCVIQLDTMEFETTVNSLEALISTYEGFLQEQKYSDGGSYNIYVSKNSARQQSYTAVIRIPSANYEEFVDHMGDLGMVRSKNSNVENVSQEYSDLSTSLEIYQADYDYYLKLIADSKDESIMLMYHDKLTDIKKQIEQIKTRMNHIDNDVAYSYVTVTIREVFEYEEDPVHVAEPKTFGQRMSKTLSESLTGFLQFLEDLLVVFIWLAPYLVLLAIVIFGCALIIRLMVKHHRKKAAVSKTEAPASEKTPEEK